MGEKLSGEITDTKLEEQGKKIGDLNKTNLIKNTSDELKILDAQISSQRRIDFVNKNNIFLENVSSSLEIDNKLLLAIIGIESNYGEIIKNKAGSGAKGVMQLTGSVFNDMLVSYDENGHLNSGRGYRKYLQFFKNISYESLLGIENQEARIALENIRRIQTDETNKNHDKIIQEKFEEQIKIIKNTIKGKENNNKSFEHLNIIVGSIYLKSLISEDKTLLQSEIDQLKLKKAEAIKLVKAKFEQGTFSGKNNSLMTTEIFTKIVEDILTKINTNNTFQKEYRAICYYNGDRKNNHHLAYGLAVLITREIHNWEN